MSNRDGRYLILLEGEAEVDPRPIAEPLARLQGLTRYEALRKVRHGGGIVAEDLRPDEAETLVKRLASLGIRSRAVPAFLLESVPEVERFARVEIGEDGLTLRTLEGHGHLFLLWEAIMLVNSALIFEGGYSGGRDRESLKVIPRLGDLPPEEASVVRENLILHLQKPPGRHAETAEPILERLEVGALKRTRAVVDLVTDEAACWVRLSGRSLVVQKDKLQVGGDLGFAVLLRKLGSRCPEQALTPLTLKLLTGHDEELVTVISLGQFHRNTLWRLLTLLSEKK